MDNLQNKGAIPGSRASAEPSSTVSALTGFDPARGSDDPYIVGLAKVLNANTFGGGYAALTELRKHFAPVGEIEL